MPRAERCRRIGMVGGGYRLPEIGEGAVESEVDRGTVAVEKTEVFAEITGEQDQPDTEERRRYDPTRH